MENNKKKEIAEFYTQILSDSKLKEKIVKKANRIATEEDLRKLVREEIMPLMKKFKVNFSEEELLSYEEETLKELSEEALKGISGGVSFKSALLTGGLLSMALFGGIGLNANVNAAPPPKMMHPSNIIIDGGYCGPSQKYTVSKDYTLTIFLAGDANGDMEDHQVNTDGKPPWYKHRKKIKKIVIKDGVTSIDDAAFYGLPKLESVTIPPSVVSIGNDAFCNCASLKRINFSEGLKHIGMNAFHNCKSLSSLTIPSSVDSIELFAFSGCDALSLIDYDGYKNPAEGCLLFGYVFPGLVAKGYENKAPIIHVTKKYEDEYGKFGEVTVLFVDDDEDDDNNNNDYEDNIEVNKDLPIAQAKQKKDENQKPKPAIRRGKRSYVPGSLFAQTEAEPQQDNNSSDTKQEKKKTKGKKKLTLKTKPKAKQKSIADDDNRNENDYSATNEKKTKPKSKLKSRKKPTSRTKATTKEKSIDYDELNETQQNENLDLNNVDPHDIKISFTPQFELMYKRKAISLDQFFQIAENFKRSGKPFAYKKGISFGLEEMLKSIVFNNVDDLINKFDSEYTSDDDDDLDNAQVDYIAKKAENLKYDNHEAWMALPEPLKLHITDFIDRVEEANPIKIFERRDSGCFERFGENIATDGDNIYFVEKYESGETLCFPIRKHYQNVWRAGKKLWAAKGQELTDYKFCLVSNVCTGLETITIDPNVKEFNICNPPKTNDNDPSCASEVYAFGRIKIKVLDLSPATNLEKVTIGDKTFYKMSSFVSMKLPHVGEINIGKSAFENCVNPGFNKLTFDAETLNVEEKAFYDCYNLEYVNCNGKNTTLGENSFSNCPVNEYIMLPRSVEHFKIYKCGVKVQHHGSRFESDDIFDYPKDILEANSDDSSSENNNDNENLVPLSNGFDYTINDDSDIFRDFSKDWLVPVGGQAQELLYYMENHDINSLTEEQIQRLLNNLNHVLGQKKEDKNGNSYLKGKWWGRYNSVSQDDILKLLKFKGGLEIRL